LYSSSSYSSSASPELDKFPRNAGNLDDTDDGGNEERDEGGAARKVGVEEEGGRVLNSSSSSSSSSSPKLDKFPRNAANKDDTDDGSNKKRDDDTSNDTKDADVTTKAENGSESANNSTQEKQMVSQSGNFSKLEKFP